MSAYTPGPWWAHKNSAGAYDVHTLRDSYPDMQAGSDCGAMVASTYNDGTDSRTRGKHEANARLIAAAPDLLEALRDIISWIPNEEALSRLGFLTDAPLQAHNKARAAISKATQP